MQTITKTLRSVAAMAGNRIVAIVASNAERYLSTELFSEV